MEMPTDCKSKPTSVYQHRLCPMGSNDHYKHPRFSKVITRNDLKLKNHDLRQY